MSEKIVKFSRLLKVFNLNNNPAYIIEMEVNESFSPFKNPIKFLMNAIFKKRLYISFFDKVTRVYDDEEDVTYLHCFSLYNKFPILNLFKQKKCILKDCTNSYFMFYNSPITHFEADCPNLTNANHMFGRCSSLKVVNADFSNVNYGFGMFYNAGLKELNLDFPNLENGSYMFHKSNIKSFSGNLKSLKNGKEMFSNTRLESFDSKTPRLKKDKDMFYKTPEILKSKIPQYFL